MRVVAWIVGAVTLVVASAYTVVSLARWEWNRALFFGLVAVAAEVGLAAALVLRRLATLEQHVDHRLARAGDGRGDGSARRALAATRDEHTRFAWLKVDPVELTGRTNVFITLVVGGGVLLSGGAWLLDKIAGSTVDLAREQRLGGDLDRIAYRPGLLVDEVDVLARPSLDRDDPRVRAFLGSDR